MHLTLETAKSVVPAIFGRLDLVNPACMLEEGSVSLIIGVQRNQRMIVVNSRWKVRVCPNVSVRPGQLRIDAYLEGFEALHETCAVIPPATNRG